MATNFNRYYEQELANLRSLAQDFSNANPAIAPMLSGSSNDPDVERLLEGVAFLNGLTLQKLDDELPEIVQSLSELMFPQMLRPIPAATIMQFTPKPGLRETAVIKADTEIASIEIEGTASTFRTIADLVIPPVTLRSAVSAMASDGSKSIKLSFTSNSGDGSLPMPSGLTLFLGDDYSSAAYLFMLLMNHVSSIKISDDFGTEINSHQSLIFPAFEQILIKSPINSLPSFRLLQEYFFMPEKYLFVEIPDLSRYKSHLKGNVVHVEICFNTHNNVQLDLTPNSFLMNVVPAVNLFSHSAEPIVYDHKDYEYRILPEGKIKEHYQIYSVDEVTGFRQGDIDPREYQPFIRSVMGTRTDLNFYRLVIKPSVLTNTTDMYLSMIYKPEEVPSEEVLSINLTCTNDALPQRLMIGDVCHPTSTSPERFSFANIRPVVPKVNPSTGERLLWKTIGNAALNLLMLSSAENLKTLLANYSASANGDHAAHAANTRRIEGLVDMTIHGENRVSRGALVHGQHIKLSCILNNFAGLGDLYLFGCVLDRFLASYSSINAYTRVELFDIISGTTFSWPMRLGTKPLL
jgi:type VI secretion system protein ImpG